MLVDDIAFVGSLNISEPYSGLKYGSGAFRDLNVLARGYDAKEIRSFFKDMITRNAYHQEVGPVNEVFDGLDQIYGSKEYP